MKKIRQRNLQLILDAACEVFADCGFSAARLSDVAERAGVAKANVLYYYRSKAQLYEAVLDSIVEPLLEASRPFAGDQPPAEALRAYVDNKMRIGAERPHAARVFSCEIMRGAPRMPAPLLERLDAQAERNDERIRQWIDEGLLAPLDPYHLLLNLWAMTESYALGGWQLARLTGQAGLDASDYRQAGTPRRGRAASAFPRAGRLSDLRRINFRVALYSKSHSEPLSLRQPRPPTSFAPHRSTP